MATITGNTFPDSLYGTIDADSIAGLGSDDALYGYDGDDSIDGGTGDDFLYGGSGNDILIGGAGEDFFFGQSGTDTASYATASTAITLNIVDTFLSSGDAFGDFFFSVEQFVLGSFDDQFMGGGAGDLAAGGNGNDTLNGLAGNDQLLGDAGNDVLIGGQGADTLNGGTNFDIVSYQTATLGILFQMGTLTFTGDAAGDVLTAVEGVRGTEFGDSVQLIQTFRYADGGAGDDVIMGSQGNDTIIGGFGADQLSGLNGNDQLFGGDDSDPANGPDEGNLLDGGAGNDSLFGGTTQDTLQGGTSADQLFGGDGADRLTGGLGADVLSGGAGYDVAVYDTAVRVDLTDITHNTGEAFGDTYSSIDQLTLSGGGSIYVGGATAMTVFAPSSGFKAFAGTGAEAFVAANYDLSYARITTAITLTLTPDGMVGTRGAAGDLVSGFVANLTLTAKSDIYNIASYPGFGFLPVNVFGGDGGDHFTLANGPQMTLDGGRGNDSFDGNFFNGIIIAGDGKDSATLTVSGAVTVGGGAGDDTFTLTGGSSAVATVSGDSGNDALTVSSVITGTLTGGTGNDLMSLSAMGGSMDGGTGNDALTFSVVRDATGFAQLLGGEGDDILTLTETVLTSFGTGQSAQLDGGAGNDHLNGATGLTLSLPVSFAFTAGWGDDTITNFHDTEDLLVFSGTVGVGLDQFADLVVTGDATFTLVTFGTESIRIEGLDIANFSAADVLIF